MFYPKEETLEDEHVKLVCRKNMCIFNVDLHGIPLHLHPWRVGAVFARWPHWYQVTVLFTYFHLNAEDGTLGFWCICSTSRKTSISSELLNYILSFTCTTWQKWICMTPHRVATVATMLRMCSVLAFPSSRCPVVPLAGVVPILPMFRYARVERGQWIPAALPFISFGFFSSQLQVNDSHKGGWWSLGSA